MNKYTVVYVANSRYPVPYKHLITRVEYIQGETLEKAIDEHIKYMKGWAIHGIRGEVAYLEGHIKQLDVGHGIGHGMGFTHTDVVITGINNSKIQFNNNGEAVYE